MSSTFETVAGIISETADIPRDQITPESHAIDDLGIDSLAFLDIASLVGEVLARFDPPAPASIDAVLEIDGEARRVAAALTGKIHA